MWRVRTTTPPGLQHWVCRATEIRPNVPQSYLPNGKWGWGKDNKKEKKERKGDETELEAHVVLSSLVLESPAGGTLFMASLQVQANTGSPPPPHPRLL